ncbi:RNA polymerase Rpc34 subunit-domain-containing protein, partial [Suillus paluster]|uniref:RNA polymerase Rpc34 subunit-domain-containing protein n=1 Tax=Suillus paluster TaxID=48578 RepID=UPI001B8702FD
MSGRKLNTEEQKLHQAALFQQRKGAACSKSCPNAAGVISFRAVMKKEIEVKKDMSGEEAMVLGHIQASANEDVSNHSVQKQLVKAIKAVRHPTRKIYMLAHLEPSVELTGGPWYTDNELDTEFIKLLSTACLHYIRDR